jgi:hypothetical protein
MNIQMVGDYTPGVFPVCPGGGGSQAELKLQAMV